MTAKLLAQPQALRRLVFGLFILIILTLSTLSFHSPSQSIASSNLKLVKPSPGTLTSPADPPVTTGLVRTWGGSLYDYGHSVAVDSSGNIVMTGSTRSFGPGSQSVFIVKYDSGGTILWQRTWGSTSYTSVAGVGFDSSGNVYAGGYNSTGSTLVLKFDPNGNLLWQKAWGGAYAYGFTVDSSGNSYVTGSLSSFTPRAFIIKFDSSGALLWQKSWGGASYDTGYAVAVDSSGSVYITGYTPSFPVSTTAYESAFILKLDSSGSLQWQKTWGGSQDDWGTSISVDPSSGNVYVYGSSGDFGSNRHPFLLKTDSSGNLIWQKIWMAAQGFSNQYGMASDSSGNVFLSAQAVNPQTGNYQVAIAKVAPSGGILWQVSWGGATDSDYSYGVALDSAGNVVLTGGAFQPPPYSYTAMNGPMFSPSLNLITPAGTLGTPALSVSNPSLTVTTPSGSTLYAGSEDAFMLTIASGGPTNVVRSPSSISVSVSIQTTVTGGTVKISGIISPPANATVALMYIRPDGSSLNKTVTTDSSGSFSDTFSPDKSGLWQVRASWSGNAQMNGAQSVLQSFQVQDSSSSLLGTSLPWLILAAVIVGFVVAMVITKPKAPKTG